METVDLPKRIRFIEKFLASLDESEYGECIRDEVHDWKYRRSVYQRRRCSQESVHRSCGRAAVTFLHAQENAQVKQNALGKRVERSYCLMVGEC